MRHWSTPASPGRRDRARQRAAGVRVAHRRTLLGRVAGWSYAELAMRNAETYTKVNRCPSAGRARFRELVAR